MDSAPTSHATSAPPLLPRREPYRTWLGSLVILAIAALFSVGLTAWNESVPGLEEIPAGTEINIGRGFTYAVTGGWSADLARTQPEETSALTRDASVFRIGSIDWTGSRDELLERARTLQTELRQVEVRSDYLPFQTESGLEGLRYSYFGDNLEGMVWVILLEDAPVAVIGRVGGVPGSMDDVMRDAETMVASVELLPAQ